MELTISNHLTTKGCLSLIKLGIPVQAIKNREGLLNLLENQAEEAVNKIFVDGLDYKRFAVATEYIIRQGVRSSINDEPLTIVHEGKITKKVQLGTEHIVVCPLTWYSPVEINTDDPITVQDSSIQTISGETLFFYSGFLWLK